MKIRIIVSGGVVESVFTDYTGEVDVMILDQDVIEDSLDIDLDEDEIEDEIASLNKVY